MTLLETLKEVGNDALTHALAVQSEDYTLFCYLQWLMDQQLSDWDVSMDCESMRVFPAGKAILEVTGCHKEELIGIATVAEFCKEHEIGITEVGKYRSLVEEFANTQLMGI